MGSLKRGGFVRWAGAATEYMLIPSGSRLIWPWATAPVLITARADETLFVRLDMQAQQASLLLRCGEDTHTVSICEGEASRPAFGVVPRGTAVSELEGLARKERPQREGAAP